MSTDITASEMFFKKKDIADSFETSVNFHLITQINNPDGSDTQSHCRQKLEPRLWAVPFT
jgi:hypothetical protein